MLVFGDTFAPPAEGLEEDVLERLKHSMALTAGQFVAHELSAGREPHPAALAAEIESSRALGRPVDPQLADPARRAAKLAEARAAAEEKPEELPFLATSSRAPGASALGGGGSPGKPGFAPA